MDAETGRDCVSTRVVRAPREAVFGAFQDPGLLARWWGPKDFSNVIHAFDFRPGGDWHFTMRGPDGAEYRNHARFVEIAAPERIVFDHLEPAHGFRMTMTFAEESGGTRVSWRMRFDSADELARVRRFIVEGNEQNFDRLEWVLREHPDKEKGHGREER